MVPIPDEPVTPGQSRDPIRVLVQAMLALYLSPVIALVCLIGGVSVLASQSVKLSGRIAGKFAHRSQHRPFGLGRTGLALGTRTRTAERKRSRVAR
jgi:hypothetical protein